MGSKKFLTPDVYLSAAICLQLKTWPEFQVDDGRVKFVFPVSDKLHKAIFAFNDGTPLNVLEYSTTLRRLKSEMFSRRDRAGGR